MGVNKTHLSLPEVDIYSDHFYPVNISRIESDIALVQAADKTYVIGEYDWRDFDPSSSSIPAMYKLTESHQQLESPQVVIGDMPWSYFGRDVPDCSVWVNHTDGYSLLYRDPNNAAVIEESIVAVRQHSWKMQGKMVGTDLPPAPCPGPLFGGPTEC